MIGRGPLRLSHLLSVSVLTAGLVYAGFLTYPTSALAANGAAARTIAHSVSFEYNGTRTQEISRASTVGVFLRERGITVKPNDYLAPATYTPLSDHLAVTYRAAVPVTILGEHVRVHVLSPADDVGALLEQQGIILGSHDHVEPALAARVPARGIVRIVRVVTWQRTERRAFSARSVHRLDFSMEPGSSHVVSKGYPGVRDVLVEFAQRDNGPVHHFVVASRIVRKAQPRIVAEGVGEYAAFARFANRGIQRTAYIGASAMNMIATAYTAGCDGCSGITAIGRPAGHGIVAVDPRVIPLGTRLYIPGYGFALAGDTGGAIRGNRIDLGFNSLRDAIEFGRREVTVYRLK